jgi:hypothetical protein
MFTDRADGEGRDAAESRGKSGMVGEGGRKGAGEVDRGGVCETRYAPVLGGEYACALRMRCDDLRGTNVPATKDY